jgi:hypothetical protein
VIGVGISIAGAAIIGEAISFGTQAVQEFANANVDNARALRRQALSSVQRGASFFGGQKICEGCVVVALILAFLAVGVSAHRIIASALGTLLRAETTMKSMEERATDARDAEKGSILFQQAAIKGRLLQRKLVGTFLFLFLTLLVRTIFSLMYALALALNEIANSCSFSECHPCKNVFSHILSWILNTPEFQYIVMVIASPVAQLVALWGMSGVRSLEQMAVQQVNLDAMRGAKGHQSLPHSKRHANQKAHAHASSKTESSL